MPAACHGKFLRGLARTPGGNLLKVAIL